MVFVTTGTAFVSSTLKKIVENQKDIQIQQKIHININHDIYQINHGNSKIVLNNVKFNVPLLKYVELCTLVACTLIYSLFVLILSIEYFDFENELARYKLRFYQELFLYQPIVQIVFPIMYLLSNKHLKDFVRKIKGGGENLSM